MRLEKASYKAIKYACMNFHYAKAVPVNTFGYSVFNDKNEWCGVILYGSGANNNLANNYNLSQGQVIELVRIALNGKQESTSKSLAISIKIIKKDLPLIKLLVSYADKDQNHNGIIYQATNWYYTGTSMLNSTDSSWIIKGKRYHGRIISDWVKSKGGLNGLTRKQFLQKYYDVNAVEYVTKGKIKYLYPLDKSLIPLCKSLSKPYPKKETNAAIVQGSAPGFQSGDGVRSDLAAQLNSEVTANA
jgi:hypothetical protein